MIALSLLVAAAPEGWGRSNLRSIAAESTIDGHAAFPHPDECTVAPLTEAEIRGYYADDAGRVSFDALPGFDRFTEQDGTIEIDGVPWVTDGVVVAGVGSYPPGTRPSATDRDGIATALRLSTACSNAADELRLQRTYPTAVLPFFYEPDQPDDEQDGITPVDLAMIPLTVAVPLPPSQWKPTPIIRDLRLIEEGVALALVTTVESIPLGGDEFGVGLAYFEREADGWRGLSLASGRLPDPDPAAFEREQAALGGVDAPLSPVTNPRSPAVRWETKIPNDASLLETRFGNSLGEHIPATWGGLIFGSWRIRPRDRPSEDVIPQLVALDAATGEERWRATGAGIGGGVAAADGVVVVFGVDGRLHGYDAITGAGLWDVQPRGFGEQSSLPQIFGGCVLWPLGGGEQRSAAATMDGIFYLVTGDASPSTACVDLHRGTVRWTHEARSHTLAALDLATGSTTWTEDLPLGADRVQVVTTGAHILYLTGPNLPLDLSDDPTVVPDPASIAATTVHSIDAVQRRTFEAVTVPMDFQLLGAAGSTYVGRSGASLVGLRSGVETATAWEVRDVDWAVADGGVVYAVTTPGCATREGGGSCPVPRSELVALNIDDGAVRWRYPLVGELSRVRFGVSDGNIHGWARTERYGGSTFLFAMDLSAAATVITPDSPATLIVGGLFVCPAEAARLDGATPTTARQARADRATCRPAVDADAVLLVILGNHELEELRIAQDGLAVIAGLPAGPYKLHRWFESTHTLVDAECTSGDVSDPVVVVVDEVAVVRLFPGRTTTCQAYVIEVATPADSSEASVP